MFNLQKKNQKTTSVAVASTKIQRIKYQGIVLLLNVNAVKAAGTSANSNE